MGIVASPSIGFGYRWPVHDKIMGDLDRLDVLEITLDHYFWGDGRQRAAIEGLAGRVKMVAHGVGLSLGTDCAPDPRYLDDVARAVERLQMPYYSEHLAFTGVPGLELANLLPLPRTDAVAERMIANIRTVQRAVPVPLVLENITRYFEWPDSTYDEAAFLNLIAGETGIKILLDVENLYVNAANLGIDAGAFIADLDRDSVHALHIAGGGELDGRMIDSHDHRVPDGAFRLFDRVLQRFSPEFLILERDRRLDDWDEIRRDVERMRDHVDRSLEPNPKIALAHGR